MTNDLKHVADGGDIASRRARIKELYTVLESSINHMEEYRAQHVPRLQG